MNNLKPNQLPDYYTPGQTKRLMAAYKLVNLLAPVVSLSMFAMLPVAAVCYWLGWSMVPFTVLFYTFAVSFPAVVIILLLTKFILEPSSGYLKYINDNGVIFANVRHGNGSEYLKECWSEKEALDLYVESRKKKCK
jgi:hypothetical protein